jgi:hypothetical protein
MRKVYTLLVAVLLGVGGAVAIGTPASAHWTTCHGVSVVCFAEHVDGHGWIWGPTPLPYGVCVGVPTSMNDKISSLWNKYGWDSSSPPLQLSAYEHNPCSRTGHLYTWGPSAYVMNIGSRNNDRISSVCLGPRQSGYCP